MIFRQNRLVFLMAALLLTLVFVSGCALTGLETEAASEASSQAAADGTSTPELPISTVSRDIEQTTPGTNQQQTDQQQTDQQQTDQQQTDQQSPTPVPGEHKAESDSVTAEPEAQRPVVQPPRPQGAPREPVKLEPGEFEPGEVTVILGESVYVEGETISAVVANGFEQTIYTEDLKSDCSIAILEHWDGVSWLAVPGCGMARLASIIAIEPGYGELVVLNPLSFHFGEDANASTPRLSPGTYRIKFSYRFEPGPEGVEPEVVYSDEFSITPF